MQSGSIRIVVNICEIWDHKQQQKQLELGQ